MGGTGRANRRPGRRHTIGCSSTKRRAGASAQAESAAPSPGGRCHARGSGLGQATTRQVRTELRPPPRYPTPAATWARLITRKARGALEAKTCLLGVPPRPQHLRLRRTSRISGGSRAPLRARHKALELGRMQTQWEARGVEQRAGRRSSCWRRGSSSRPSLSLSARPNRSWGSRSCGAALGARRNPAAPSCRVPSDSSIPAPPPPRAY